MPCCTLSRRVEAPIDAVFGVFSDIPRAHEMIEQITAIDTDKDGQIASAEFVAFFTLRDDGDLVWSLDRSRRRGGARSRPMSGPPAGEPAPDFALRSPEGGPTVTLSSFRKNVPVALIFGSYT